MERGSAIREDYIEIHRCQEIDNFIFERIFATYGEYSEDNID